MYADGTVCGDGEEEEEKPVIDNGLEGVLPTTSPAWSPSSAATRLATFTRGPV